MDIETDFVWSESEPDHDLIWVAYGIGVTDDRSQAIDWAERGISVGEYMQREMTVSPQYLEND